MAMPTLPTTPGVSRPIRVLIVDDSALVRKVLSEIIRRDPRFEVIGSAGDPFEAREKIKALNPDVLTLDVEMPKMDGITFLGNLMRLRPMPVVMVSSLTAAGAETTLQALEIGAVDYVAKPALGVAEGLDEMADDLREKIAAAARARIGSRPRPVRTGATTAKAAASGAAASGSSMLRTTDRVVAIGASTGGTEAIADVLAVLPPDTPGVVITQHIPETFSGRFAQRLDGLSALAVREARDGDQVLLGHAYVAPGNHHLELRRSGAKYYCRVTEAPPVNRHRPSVDVLFRSVATEVGPNAVGVLLTGMGADGADGLLDIKRAGAPTIAQDQETSVVWGMPGEAVKRGAADSVLPLGEIAPQIMKLLRR
jgi:two-component system chemotaxis response regulator CheB